jgi:hypothetical protein
VSCVRAETPASVERGSQQVPAPRVGRCSDSSNSIASGASIEQRQTAGFVQQQQSRLALLLFV